jgi:steroid delta-isomerase-like uncharacterized protein
MSEDNRALIKRWFEEVWNKGRADAIEELFAEDGIAHGLTDAEGRELRGPAHFRTFFEGFRGAFSDIEIVVEDTVAEGDKVAARCSLRAHHLSDSLGYAATNNAVEFTGMCIVRIADGKIAEAWNNFDFMTMFQQIGVLQLNPADASRQDEAPLLPAQD